MRRLRDEAARYNIGEIERNVNVPTLALRYLETGALHRSNWEVGDVEEIAGRPGRAPRLRGDRPPHPRPEPVAPARRSRPGHLLGRPRARHRDPQPAPPEGSGRGRGRHHRDLPLRFGVVDVASGRDGRGLHPRHRAAGPSTPPAAGRSTPTTSPPRWRRRSWASASPRSSKRPWSSRGMRTLRRRIGVHGIHSDSLHDPARQSEPAPGPAGPAGASESGRQREWTS